MSQKTKEIIWEMQDCKHRFVFDQDSWWQARCMDCDRTLVYCLMHYAFTCALDYGDHADLSDEQIHSDVLTLMNNFWDIL